MKFYPHHIGDFNNATRHLTRVERCLYREAIELYYDTECVLTKDINKLSKRLLCITEEEKNALILVLNEFFIENDDGFYNSRCELEIEKYRQNSSNKARAGIASAEARKKLKEINKRLTPVEHVNNMCATNQEPITNNQEPIIKEKNNKKEVVNGYKNLLDEYGIKGQLAIDFATLRKSKNAPITFTAMQRMKKQADKSGISFADAVTTCIERGWQSYISEWDKTRKEQSKHSFQAIDYGTTGDL